MKRNIELSSQKVFGPISALSDQTILAQSVCKRRVKGAFLFVAGNVELSRREFQQLILSAGDPLARLLQMVGLKAPHFAA